MAGPPYALLDQEGDSRPTSRDRGGSEGWGRDLEENGGNEGLRGLGKE